MKMKTRTDSWTFLAEVPVMATAGARPYRHSSVLFPARRLDTHPDRIQREWPRINAKNHLASKRFPLAGIFETFTNPLLLV